MKAIIWDLDGTLLYTLDDLHEAVNHALKEYGLPMRSYEETRMSVGKGVRNLMRLSTPMGEDNPLFEEVFASFRKYYLVHCQDHTVLYPGIPDALVKLKEMGIRMAIVSNKMQSGVDELYAKWFADTIELAIGERQEIRRKPAPDMVELALREMRLEKDEALYIGDSDVDLATARNSGLQCISVLWGFRDKDFLLSHGATHLVEKPEEIIEYITTLSQA